MSTFQIALLSATPRVPFPEIQRVANALQRQLIEDFTPVWTIPATIIPVERLDQVPPGASPIIVRDVVGDDSVFGFHRLEPHNLADPLDDQPFAVVEYTPFWWPLDASHECLEMIIDPAGNALEPGYDPLNRRVTVSYLKEICDPLGRRDAHYLLDGVPVCDFYTPAWFEADHRPGVDYSRKRKLGGPRTLRAGGYVAYLQPSVPSLGMAAGWHLTEFDGQNYQTSRINAPNIYGSLREWIDVASEPFLARDARCLDTRAALRTAARTYREARRITAQAQRATARRWRRALRDL